MIFGSTYSFAILAEIHSDTGGCGYTTGTISFFINGKKYPQSNTTSVMETELSALTGDKSPFVSLANITIPFSPLTQEDIQISVTEADGKVKISVSQSDVLIDTTAITLKQFAAIAQKIIEFTKQI